MKRNPYLGKPGTAAAVIHSLLILLLGLALGAASKYADLHSVILGDLTSGIALWIFLAAAVALYSRTPERAGLHAILLLGGMVAAYYAAAELLGGSLPKNYLIGWGAAALLSPIPGWMVWYAGGEDRLAWLLSIGTVAVQIGATVLLFGKLGLADLAVVVLTAALLFWNKVKNVEKPGNRGRRR